MQIIGGGARSPRAPPPLFLRACVVNSHALPTVPVYRKIELPNYHAYLKQTKKQNSVQKFCCNGFSKFLLLFVILDPTSL